MASLPRDCVKDEPVLITSRCVLRAPEARWNAIVELLRELYADPRWPEQGVEAAHDVIERHPDVIDKKALCVPIQVAVWAGEEAARRAREAVLTAPREWVEFSARTAPRVGGVITVVIREGTPSPAHVRDLTQSPSPQAAPRLKALRTAK